MESALYGVYTLVVLYQKSHSFASLTRSISDTPQLVCKHRTHALSMKYSICIVLYFILFHTYWDFRIKFCFVKKRFGFHFDQSERRNEFLTCEKIVSSNHKPRFKRTVFSRAFSRSSRVALSGSFAKILYFRCTRVVRNSIFQVIKS